MITKVPENQRQLVKPFFEEFEDTLIRSYLEGHMGEAWVDDLDHATAAQITVSIFTFFAGDPNTPAVEALLRTIPEDVLIITESEDWQQLIETIHAGAFEKYSRYRFENSADAFDRQHLQNLVNQLPLDYTVRIIDETVIEMPSLHELSEDFTGNFESAEDFLNRGIGYAVIHEGEVVSGASSFSVYDEGIEIEVGTHPDYRRKGLAAVASAALILDCLDRQLYPNWDADNIGSVKLAQQLGYILKEPYDTYYVTTRKKG